MPASSSAAAVFYLPGVGHGPALLALDLAQLLAEPLLPGDDGLEGGLCLDGLVDEAAGPELGLWGKARLEALVDLRD